MTAISIEKAQIDLPDLIRRALQGEEIVITAEGHAHVRLLPVGFDDVTAEKRGYGSWAGKFEVSDSFFDPLTDEECGYGADPK